MKASLQFLIAAVALAASGAGAAARTEQLASQQGASQYDTSEDLTLTDGVATAGPTSNAATSTGWPEPDPRELPDGPDKEQILYGERLIRETYGVIGPEVANSSMRYAGNNLACGACHLDGGRRQGGLSLIGVHDAYPANMARENELRSLTQRINGCMERSMNGRALPEDSNEIAAMIAYIRFLSDAAPANLDGRGAPGLEYLERAADPAKGAVVFESHCASCHGADGLGVRNGEIGDAAGYLYPPLWGPDSFNDGAGMHRITKAAAFIRSNMPFGVTFDAPILTPEEAYDVAAYINVQNRPHKDGLDRDYPDRSRKPVDAPFEPFADDFPLAQHKFGPWKPIAEARKKN